ncbi:MAG TPA: PDZ domain-containing protein [Solirubrobacteraceae bacterium]|nr:PDZ domain-containing protein [Solirubrobacteraceae bacterium]
MSSPKHLWSGDWERESDARTVPPGELTPDPGTHLAGPAPVRAEPLPPRVRSRRRLPRRLSLGLAGLCILIVAAVGVALGTGGASPGRSHRAAGLLPAPQSPLTPSPASPAAPPASTAAAPTQTVPVRLGPAYTWLGMQISETPAGLTVATVAMNSAGDLAGVNPGDVIEAVNGRTVASPGTLRSITAALPLGHPVSLTVNRGSTSVQLSARLSDRPVRQR